MCREHSEIDLILMDIQMPDMNGYEATKIIKEFRPHLPVIAQSAYAMQDEKEVSMSVGCAAFIAKPFTKKQLFDTISEVLSLSA
jgi:CheY-like chemotaxis protein